jgi:hypothetical protein
VGAPPKAAALKNGHRAQLEVPTVGQDLLRHLVVENAHAERVPAFRIRPLEMQPRRTVLSNAPDCRCGLALRAVAVENRFIVWFRDGAPQRDVAYWAPIHFWYEPSITARHHGSFATNHSKVSRRPSSTWRLAANPSSRSSFAQSIA